LGFLLGNSRLKLGITSDFITQSKLLGGSTPQTPRAVSFSHQNIKSKSDHCLGKMRSDRQLFKYMLSLIEKLKQVKDFRKDKGKRHPLWIVLVVIILGTMLGYSG
jgi:hypothetical protein